MSEQFVIKHLEITGPSTNEVSFKLYPDGDVMLKQGGDLVYLTAPNFELLKQFMKDAA